MTDYQINRALWKMDKMSKIRHKQNAKRLKRQGVKDNTYKLPQPKKDRIPYYKLDICTICGMRKKSHWDYIYGKSIKRDFCEDCWIEYKNIIKIRGEK